MELSGRCMLVVGGIGAAISRRALAAGATVVGLDLFAAALDDLREGSSALGARSFLWSATRPILMW